MNLRYKIIKRAPLEVVITLYKEAGWWKESRLARAVVPKIIRNSFCFMVAVKDDGEIVGMGRVISDRVSDAYIQDVVVKKALRGRGIGHELVKRLARFCMSHKLEWIGLVAEPGTRKFYEALGFKELRRYVPMLHK